MMDVLLPRGDCGRIRSGRGAAGRTPGTCAWVGFLFALDTGRRRPWPVLPLPFAGRGLRIRFPCFVLIG
jgi:hypothetical protein